MGTSIIEINHLTRKYEKGSNTILAVNNLSCQLREGSFTSIVGKSGSGKSTLLNLIGGLDKPDSGKIIVSGKDISALPRKALADHRRKTVGIIFQSFNLIQHRTAAENVELALAFGGMTVRKRKMRSTELLTMVGLGERKDHYPAELSGGETQRVSIARALANHPRVLLADEPTGNLDSQTSQEIIQLIQKINKKEGLTVIMVTHDQDIAGQVSNHIIALKDGKIINENFYDQ